MGVNELVINAQKNVLIYVECGGLIAWTYLCLVLPSYEVKKNVWI